MQVNDIHKRVSEDMYVITRPQTSIRKNKLLPQHCESKYKYPVCRNFEY